MRVETKRLLDRLGQPDFSYREYNDAKTEASNRWPLFELVERQMRRPASRLVSETPQDAIEIEAMEQSAPVSQAPANDVKSLIGRLSGGRGA